MCARFAGTERIYSYSLLLFYIAGGRQLSALTPLVLSCSPRRMLFKKHVDGPKLASRPRHCIGDCRSRLLGSRDGCVSHVDANYISLTKA